MHTRTHPSGGVPPDGVPIRVRVAGTVPWPVVPIREGAVVTTTPTRPPSSLGWTPGLPSPGRISMDRGETLLGATLPSCYWGGQQSFEPKKNKTNQTNNKLKLGKKKEDEDSSTNKKEPQGGARPLHQWSRPLVPKADGRMDASFSSQIPHGRRLRESWRGAAGAGPAPQPGLMEAGGQG